MLHAILSMWWAWVIPLAFIGVLVYALNPKRKKQFEAEARVPLEDNLPPK